MKIVKGFSLRNIAGNNIIVPIGTRNISFKGMITLNDSGAFLWQQLQTDKVEEDLLAAVLDEYEVDEATAKKDLDKFLSTLKTANLLD